MPKELSQIIEEIGCDFYELRKELTKRVEALEKTGQHDGLSALQAQLDAVEAKLNEPFSVGTGGGSNAKPLTFKTQDGREIKSVSGPTDRLSSNGPPNLLGRQIRTQYTGRLDPDLDEKSQSLDRDSGGGVMLPGPVALAAAELARSASVVSQAGATTLVMPEGANNAVALKVTGDPMVVWVPEGGTIPESDITFGMVKVNLRKAATLVTCSRELIEFGMNAPQLIEDTMRAAMAAEIDRVALLGTGGDSEPTGINAYGGVGEITGVGDVNYDDVLNAMKTVRAANHAPNAAIWSPATDYELSILKDANDGQYLAPPRGYNDLPKFITSKATDALAFVGDFSKLFWSVGASGMRLETSISSKFGSDQVQIRLIMGVDVWLSHPAAFCVLRGLS